MRSLLDFSEFMEAKKEIIVPGLVHSVDRTFISLLIIFRRGLRKKITTLGRATQIVRLRLY